MLASMTQAYPAAGGLARRRTPFAMLRPPLCLRSPMPIWCSVTPAATFFAITADGADVPDYRWAARSASGRDKPDDPEWASTPACSRPGGIYSGESAYAGVCRPSSFRPDRAGDSMQCLHRSWTDLRLPILVVLWPSLAALFFFDRHRGAVRRLHRQLRVLHAAGKAPAGDAPTPRASFGHG